MHGQGSLLALDYPYFCPLVEKPIVRFLSVASNIWTSSDLTAEASRDADLRSFPTSIRPPASALESYSSVSFPPCIQIGSSSVAPNGRLESFYGKRIRHWRFSLDICSHRKQAK